MRHGSILPKKSQIVWDDVPEKKNATEDANIISPPVMLHEKHVAIEYVMTDVHCEPTVKKLDNGVEERRDCPGLDVGTDTSLC